MKNIITITTIVVFICLPVGAQDQKKTDLLEKNRRIDEINKFSRKDAYSHPYINQEVKSFMDFINRNPILDEVNMDADVSRMKIDVVESLYENTKDSADRLELANLLLRAFPAIQAARDKLGVNPMSETEGWLHMVPKPFPGEDTQDWTNRIDAETNKQIKSIDILESIHRRIYEVLTEHMKIKIAGVSKELERSSEEKARTKEMLEKYAAAHGRKQPESKASTDDGE